MSRPPPTSTLFPYTTLFRSDITMGLGGASNGTLYVGTTSGKLYEFDQTSLAIRSEEHTSELQSHSDLVCRLLLEKKKNEETSHEACTDLHSSHTYTIDKGSY